MIAIRRNISLARRMHYRIGGKARYFCEPQNAHDIVGAVRWAFARRIPFLFLGAGTNMLFSERGYDGLIMQYVNKHIRKEAGGVRISAGTSMQDAVRYHLAQGLDDLAWAGGLPGTVGGAVFGNAGCFGGEMKDCVVSVESIFYDRAAGMVERRVRSAAECAFGYRDSVFKRNGNEIIASVVVRATPGDKQAVCAEVERCIAYRERFQPLEYPSAGSTFKNIPVASVTPQVRKEFASVVKVDPFPVIPVAAVLDRLDLKGSRIGGAEISEKHPNFFINRNRATFADVIGLIKLAKKKALGRYGIVLEEEIRIVP
ncbi:UDP-N-acetylenolpyruvoylglucosamine reductase [Candidatus Wolfebacteria bacterium RIFOXYB1_FULL_54_12]|uniref:UDP-N-acetylenolpyruvoylglucosamine reductase n=1 Tax=Candidatus Wolfebacteria bacterium RIFOXYB1_FULL_54_12 TaxID=1802559 RepID=A0A1F8DX96_9BACT|nr:MAG: UDP-N-acetylenolpyruvoylglucosamine reductase [Candidatus Wolfebacteria bacterium RIFOXYB1_FULL_54_12]